jgi:LDH2 family malate/lactate/ureidoglycolate dehydrogenase
VYSRADVNLEGLKSFVAEIFARLGMPEAPARLSAAALVAADVEGMPAHGVKLVPAYVERILAGSASTETDPKLVHDGGSAIVLDAGNILGPLSSDWAIPMVSERAREHGLACVAVRNGAQFGSAGFWARQIAEGGLIGIAMCSSRPLKAAPAFALALPSADAHPFLLDLQAPRAPADPAAALARLLLADGADKHARHAAAVELLCAGLSGGTVGMEAGSCCQLFMAIDPNRFGIADLPERVAGYAALVTAEPRRAPNGEWQAPPELVTKLKECAAKVGVERTLE